MSFIQTVPIEEAAGELREIYAGHIETMGYVPNYTRALSLMPEAVLAWRSFIGTLRKGMRLRRYELITIAVVTGLKCRY